MSYAVTETDELEAFGRDDAAYDTSAGLDPEDRIEENLPASDIADGPPAKRGRWCLCLVICVLALAATAAFFGVFFGLRGGGSDDRDRPEEPAAPAGAAPPAEAAPPVAPVAQPAAEVRTFDVRVVEKLPHDKNAFTQGFEYAEGAFFESTGLHGRSTLRKVEMATGRVVQKYDLERSLFGEGMTLHTTHHIFMLTWKAGRGLIFNQSTFELIKEWKYEGEGWGLTMDREADEVYMSDGTTELRVLDPEDLSEKRRVTVTLNGKHVSDLNEIEWICGEVWSNVWQTNKIYRIDPQTGKVKSIINAGNLPLPGDRYPGSDVLNGIAFDKAQGRLWLTGKLWPTIYQVSVNDDSLDLTKC